MCNTFVHAPWCASHSPVGGVWYCLQWSKRALAKKLSCRVWVSSRCLVFPCCPLVWCSPLVWSGHGLTMVCGVCSLTGSGIICPLSISQTHVRFPVTADGDTVKTTVQVTNTLSTPLSVQLCLPSAPPPLPPPPPPLPLPLPPNASVPTTTASGSVTFAGAAPTVSELNASDVCGSDEWARRIEREPYLSVTPAAVTPLTLAPHEVRSDQIIITHNKKHLLLFVIYYAHLFVLFCFYFLIFYFFLFFFLFCFVCFSPPITFSSWTSDTGRESVNHMQQKGEHWHRRERGREE